MPEVYSDALNSIAKHSSFIRIFFSIKTCILHKDFSLSKHSSFIKKKKVKHLSFAIIFLESNKRPKGYADLNAWFPKCLTLFITNSSPVYKNSFRCEIDVDFASGRPLEGARLCLTTSISTAE